MKPATYGSTTKQAILPSGEVMHFQPDTPDDHVHRLVRDRMGLPPPVMPEDLALEAQQQATGVMQTAQQSAERLTQATAALHQQLGILMQSLQQTTQRMVTANHDAVRTITSANTALATSVARLSEVAGHLQRCSEQAVTTSSIVTEAAIKEMKVAVIELAQRFDETATTMAKAVAAPKKAVKGKDGAWRSEPC